MDCIPETEHLSVTYFLSAAAARLCVLACYSANAYLGTREGAKMWETEETHNRQTSTPNEDKGKRQNEPNFCRNVFLAAASST